MTQRQASFKDALELQSLINEAFNRNEVNSIDKTFFDNPNILTLVAEKNNVILGTASLHLITKLDRQLGQIEDVVVSPQAQGKGIGKKLVAALLTSNEAKNCYKIILNTDEQKIPFYEKLGFVKEEIQMAIRN